MTLSGQLILLVVGSIMASTLVAILVLYLAVERQIDTYEEDRIIRDMATVFDRLQSEPERNHLLVTDLSSASDAFYWVSDEPRITGQIDEDELREVIALHLPDENIKFLEIEMEGSFIWTHLWNLASLEECVREAAQMLEAPDCSLRIFSLELENGRWLNASTIHEPSMAYLVIPVSFVSFITMLVLFVSTAILVKRLVRPLSDLSETVERFGRGEAGGPLPVRGPKELLALTDAFNLMQERLTRFVEDRTRMLGAISHDLRTPITSLRIQTELVNDQPLRQRMINVLEDMERMVSATLNFSKLGSVEGEVEEIDLVELLSDLSQEHPAICFAGHMETCFVAGRRLSLKRAFRNLLDNAIKYGQSATVALEVNETTVKIVISDKGPGIDPELQDEVFEPFVRLDEARNVESGSVGLGLSIARTILHHHGGAIELKNLAPGLEVTVTLPR